MKKFFRNLFSGYFLVLLILLIELAIIVFVQFYLDDVVKAVIDDPTISQKNIDIIIALIY